jgi:hypothetical protein
METSVVRDNAPLLLEATNMSNLRRVNKQEQFKSWLGSDKIETKTIIPSVNHSGGFDISTNFWRVNDSPIKLSIQKNAIIFDWAQTTLSKVFPSMPNLDNACSPVFATGPRNGPLDLDCKHSNSFIAKPMNPHLMRPIFCTHLRARVCSPPRYTSHRI